MVALSSCSFQFSQFSRSVMSDSLRPHEAQHARPPCPSPTPRVYPNSCPLSQWCHPTISSSVVPFSSCPQSFPTSGSFQMSQLFTSGGQSIGSFSCNISPSSEHPGLISSVNGTYYSALTKLKIIKKLGVQFFGINRCDTCMKLLLNCILILHYNIVHSQARGRIFSQVKYYQVVESGKTSLLCFTKNSLLF